MGRRSRRLRAPLTALAAIALIAVGPGAASADEDSLRDVITSVQNGQLPGAPDDPAGTPGTGVPSPTSDDDSDGHETKDPSAPDHGRATVADGDLAGHDVLTGGDNDASVADDDSTTADSTLLAIGGQEVMGTHADSSKTNESHFGDPLAPLCDGSDGQVCLRLLFADAWATDDGGTSSSRSQNGVADACLGGTSADREAECDGPVSVGAVTSKGKANRDQASGQTTADSESEVAGVCLKQDPTTEGCDAGLRVLHSDGQSDSGGAQASANRDSYLAAAELGKQEQLRIGDPQGIALPPGCPEGAAVLCLFLNQGETYVGDRVAGHAQEALHASVLPGNLDLIVELSRSESLVHNDGRADATVSGPQGGTAGSGGPGAPGNAAGGVLPNTGGFWSGLLALGLFGVGAGALLTAIGRRRALSAA